MYSNGKVNSAKLQLLLHQPTTTSWKHNGEQDMHNSSLHERTFLGANIAFESLGLLIYKKKNKQKTSLACRRSRGRKELDMTLQLNKMG